MSPIVAARANRRKTRRHNSVTPIPTKAKTPSGRTTVLKDASTAASVQRSRLTARKVPNRKATNSGSDPPRNERCIQSKFRTAKKLATHPPQSRYASITAARDEAKETSNKAVRSEMRVRIEIAAIK